MRNLINVPSIHRVGLAVLFSVICLAMAGCGNNGDPSSPSGSLPDNPLGNPPGSPPGSPIDNPPDSPPGNKTLIEQVWIPAGTFQMGSLTSEPGRDTDEVRHQVTLTSGFFMGKYPVTQAQYETVMESNPGSFTAPVAPETNTNNRPVETVSWYDALVFCNKLSLLEELTPAYRIPGFNNSTDPADWGDAPSINDETWNAAEIVDGSTGYRLPTEAQWEYACRAGTTTAFNWETNYIDDRKANYDASYLDANNTVTGTYLARTSEVGSYPPNKWGLCDMHGNVWEWCGDWYGTYANGAQTDPVGASSGSMRVIRGGYWFSGGHGVRSAYRGGSSLHIRANRNGLRLIRPGS